MSAEKKNNAQLQTRIAALQRQVTELRGQQLQNCESEAQLEDFLQSQIKRRKQVPKCISKLRTFVRRVTLRHLERELRKKHTKLFQHKDRKTRTADGKLVKKVYAELHFPTFIHMVRPALLQLLQNNLGDEKLCSKVLNAMMFVTRGRRANHLQSYKKFGRPMEDIYSPGCESSSPSYTGSSPSCVVGQPSYEYSSYEYYE